MNLTNDDVREILRLLDSSPFDELRLDTDRFKLILRRPDTGGWTQETQTLARDTPAPAVAVAKTKAAAAPLEPGTVAIMPPLMGTFYRAPKPGAAPFVEIGFKVEVDTTIGIVETMKLMNSVPAGARGTVVAIHVENGEFVDQDRTLMILRVEP